LEVLELVPYIALTLQTQIMKLMTERKRRSVRMEKAEHVEFIALYLGFHTKLDAEEAIGISRQILDMVVLKGSASTDSIGKIRKYMKAHRKSV
jgi:Na+-transporting methylmalonyl-CoA/oxaloacetate decarboxylase beta subunit